MTTKARWDRLAGTLAEAGITTEVDATLWEGKVVCSITLRATGGLITIRDTWWHDNWTGWQVAAEDSGSITVWESARTKKRGEVARHVQDALQALAAKTADAPQVGDVVFLFRQDDDADLDGAPPLLMQHAVMAALRQAGLLPAKDPERDARDIAEFKERSRMARPQVRRYGRGGWNR